MVLEPVRGDRVGVHTERRYGCDAGDDQEHHQPMRAGLDRLLLCGLPLPATAEKQADVTRPPSNLQVGYGRHGEDERAAADGDENSA